MSVEQETKSIKELLSRQPTPCKNDRCDKIVADYSYGIARSIYFSFCETVDEVGEFVEEIETDVMDTIHDTERYVINKVEDMVIEELKVLAARKAGELVEHLEDKIVDELKEAGVVVETVVETVVEVYEEMDKIAEKVVDTTMDAIEDVVETVVEVVKDVSEDVVDEVIELKEEVVEFVDNVNHKGFVAAVEHVAEDVVEEMKEIGHNVYVKEEQLRHLAIEDMKWMSNKIKSGAKGISEKISFTSSHN